MSSSSPSQQPQDQQPRRPESPSRMQPTKAATLLVAGLATAALSWVLIGNVYGDIPDLPWIPSITVFGLALAEIVLARATKARIDRKPGAAPVDPLAVVRYVVLAKASSLAGAIFSGFYSGVLIWLLVEHSDNTHAIHDRPAAAGGLVAALALVTGGLLLERACRVPPQPKDDDQPE